VTSPPLPMIYVGMPASAWRLSASSVRASSMQRTALVQPPDGHEQLAVDKVALQLGSPSVASTIARGLVEVSAAAATSSASAVGVPPPSVLERTEVSSALTCPVDGQNSGLAGTMHS